MNKTRILLADDHALIRAGIRSLLHESEELTVVAEACDGRQAISMVKKHMPDVAILDVTMPDLNGLEATEQIKRDFPGVWVLMLSAYDELDFVVQALKVGASGYLLKDAAREELALAVRVAMRGQIYLTPAISRPIIERYVQSSRAQPGPISALTPRLREILTHIAEGKRTKEIAFELGVSIKTVEAHRAILMERLDIHNVAGLVRYALRVGLITLDS
jgi:DNA-binding NarL/FixJ family response regulator